LPTDEGALGLTMSCLYQSDYGPVDPSFDPVAGNGALLIGVEAHVRALSQAQNRGQLEAMKRQLQRGQTIQWCDQGYGWTYAAPVTAFFDVAFVLLILPWLVLRVVPALRRRRRALTTAKESP
jgi:hypothetical protein